MIKQLTFEDVQNKILGRPRPAQVQILIDALADLLAETLPEKGMEPIDTLLGKIEYWATSAQETRAAYKTSLIELQLDIEKRIREF